MKIITTAITLLLIISAPLWADIIILKNGKVFEGEIIRHIVTDEGEQVEVKTEYGILNIFTSDLKQIAKNVEDLLKPADKLWAEAKACYERALELRENPIAKNEELLKGKNLLYEANQVYVEIQQAFPQEKYAWIEHKRKDILDLMKEFRCARVRVTEKDYKRVDYQEKLSEIRDSDTEGHYQLALWCEKAGLKEEMLAEFAKVIKIDPNHIQAREKLGYIIKGDEWVHKEDSFEEELEPLIKEPELLPPPKPLTFNELVALLKSGTAEDKLDVIVKFSNPPEDKAIQPLINEFTKIDQDPEVYESIKFVLPKFNPSKIASAMKRIIGTKKIAVRTQTDALKILSSVDQAEYIKLLTKAFLDKAKILSRSRAKSEQKIAAYKEMRQLRFLISKSPAKDEAVPLLAKYFRPSAKPAIKENIIKLLVNIKTEKAAAVLVNQLRSGTANKELQPIIEAIKAIGLHSAFMPLVDALDNEQLKKWSFAVLSAMTRQRRFGYDQEKWLAWWETVKDNLAKIKPEKGLRGRPRR